MLGDNYGAESNCRKAQDLNPDYCFPNRIEEILLLNKALSYNPEDSKALYYLGNYWYANLQYEDAFNAWKKSASINKNFPTVLRNLSLVWYNKKHNPLKAVEMLEKAFFLDQTDSRILMELDQLYKRTGKSIRFRLSLLERNITLVENRDDLYLERVTLYNQAGNYKKARELIMNHTFHPWEGGEGKVKGQYVICNLGLAIIELKKQHFAKSIDLLKAAMYYPENLGEGKLHGALENNIHYYLGCAYEKIQITTIP
jgi:tetratricopeptide (TPR) repeat protein